MSAYTAINAIIEEKLLNLHTAMPCKVLSYANGEATIQPLYLKVSKHEEGPYPPIEGVPVLKQRFKYSYEDGTPAGTINRTKTTIFETVYEKGDIVLVVFSERALDNVMTGKIAHPEFNRRHSINDAVIVGLIQ